MLTRQSAVDELTKAREALSMKGWSQRRAAKELGVTHEHLNRVLCGHRESRRLLQDIHGLPFLGIAYSKPTGKLGELRIGRKGGRP